MSDSPAGPPGPEDRMERPIRGLAEQELVPSAAFMARVRGRIHRRATVSYLASYSWSLPKVMLTELAGVIRHLFLALGGGKDS